MKVKDLKELIANCDDNGVVLIEDVDGSCLEIVNGGVSKDGDRDCVYLSTRQQFPEGYYKDGDEIRWINGEAVIPTIPDDEVFELNLVNSEIFKDDDEHSVLFEFHDGYALCRDDASLEMTYPKLCELTDSQIEEIDAYTGGRVSNSGCVTPGDVCLKFGVLEKRLSLDRDGHLLCESIQEITLYAWPKVWDNNKYDQDSRNVLETLRNWGVEFENYWQSQLAKDEYYCDTHDYREEIWDFAKKKCEEYLADLKD